MTNIFFKPNKKNSIIDTYNHLRRKNKNPLKSSGVSRVFGDKRLEASEITEKEFVKLEKLSSINSRAIYDYNYKVLMQAAVARQKEGQEITIEQLKGSFHYFAPFFLIFLEEMKHKIELEEDKERKEEKSNSAKKVAKKGSKKSVSKRREREEKKEEEEDKEQNEQNKEEDIGKEEEKGKEEKDEDDTSREESVSKTNVLVSNNNNREKSNQNTTVSTEKRKRSFYFLVFIFQ